MSMFKRVLIGAAVAAVVGSLLPAVSSPAKVGKVIQPFPATKKFTQQEKQALNKQWAGKPHHFREPGRDGVVMRQPNGYEFAAFVSPAEVGGRMEDATRRTIIKNSRGWWTYAKKGKSGLVATNLIVGRNEPTGIAPHVGRTQAIFINPKNGTDIRAQLYEAFRAQSVAATQTAQAAAEVRSYKIPAILFETYDEFQPGSNAEATAKFLNGYSDTNSTVTEFYQEMSYGQMRAEIDVFGPYQSVISQVDRCHYGGITVAGNALYASPQNQITGGMGVGAGGGGVAGMAAEAIPMADVDIDFTEYDNDGDGFVDLVFIIHSGPDMAITGDPCMTWSHAISLQPLVESTGLPIAAGIPTNDGVFVANLNTVPELDVPNGMDVGVVSHEMSHNLGEPDFYDTSYKSEGTGGWDNMAEGSHFGDPPGSNPIHFNPMVKLAQAWIDPKIVTQTTKGLKLRPWEVYPDLAIVPLRRGDDPSTEATETDSIIEGQIIHFSSRSAHGPRNWGSPIDGKDMPALFDRNLLNSGVLIWHMDRSIGNNNDSSRYRLDLEEFDRLDGTQELALGQGGGEPTDPWFDTATGLSGTTRKGAPGALPATLTFSGTAVPSGAIAQAPPAYTYEFTVPDNPTIYSFTITETCASEGGDWDLYVDQFIDGAWVEVTSGATGACSESAGIVRPELGGQYRARIANFLAPDVAGGFTGTVSWGKGEVFFSADTYDNEGKATGWTIGNVRPGADAISLASEVMSSAFMTLDIIKDTRADVSPGFVRSGEAILDGSTAKLSVNAYNNGPAAASDVTVTLREGATVIQEKAIGTLAGSTSKPVELSWKPGTVGRHELTVTVATGSAEASTDNNTQASIVWVYPANATSGVLVVDDDDNFEMQQAYEGALLALGVPYAVTDRHPTLAELKRYPAVFWHAGRAQQEGAFDRQDREALKAYLDQGGKVWFSSPWVAGALAAGTDTTYGAVNPGSDPAFAANYIGVGFQFRIARGGGLAIPAGGFMKRQIAYKPFPGRGNSSVAKLATSAFGTVTKIFDWKQESTDVGVGGTAVVGDAAHKGFRTVYTGFNLGSVLTPEDQIDLVSAVLKQLALPATVSVSAAGYTPDGPVVHHVPIQWALRGEPQVITATVGGVDVTGVTLFYRTFLKTPLKSVEMSERAHGIFEAVLGGGVFQPPGVEYSILVKTASGTIKLPDVQGGGYFVPIADGPATPELPYSISRVLGARFTPSGVNRPRPAPAPQSRGDDLPATGLGSGLIGVLPLAAAIAGAVWLRRRRMI